MSWPYVENRAKPCHNKLPLCSVSRYSNILFPNSVSVRVTTYDLDVSLFLLHCMPLHCHLVPFTSTVLLVPLYTQFPICFSTHDSYMLLLNSCDKTQSLDLQNHSFLSECLGCDVNRLFSTFLEGTKLSKIWVREVWAGQVPPPPSWYSFNPTTKWRQCCHCTRSCDPTVWWWKELARSVIFWLLHTVHWFKILRKLKQLACWQHLIVAISWVVTDLFCFQSGKFWRH